MDLTRIREAEEIIRTKVQVAYPNVLCVYDGLDAGGLTIGQNRIRVLLLGSVDADKMATSRYAISVKAETQPPRRFKENAKGWFDFDRIFECIVAGVQADQDYRRAQERQDLLNATSKNLAKQIRLKYHLPDNLTKGRPPVLVSPCFAVPGTVEITVSNVSQETAGKLLEMIRSLGLMNRDDGDQRAIWDHLADDGS